MLALFSKDRKRAAVGFAFYRQVEEVRNLDREVRRILEEGRAPVWIGVVRATLASLGGEADLSDIYGKIEGRRPTGTRHWREKVRQSLRRGGFVRVGRGRWALPEAA